MKLLGFLLTMILLYPTLLSELKILSTPDGDTHPAPCALTCSGVARYNEYGDFAWQTAGRRAYKRTDIFGCGFVSTPVVTFTVRTPGISILYNCPPIRPYGSYATRFGVITMGDATPSQIISMECDIYWIATGYNC